MKWQTEARRGLGCFNRHVVKCYPFDSFHHVYDIYCSDLPRTLWFSYPLSIIAFVRSCYCSLCVLCAYYSYMVCCWYLLDQKWMSRNWLTIRHDPPNPWHVLVSIRCPCFLSKSSYIVNVDLEVLLAILALASMGCLLVHSRSSVSLVMFSTWIFTELSVWKLPTARLTCYSTEERYQLWSFGPHCKY